MNKFLKLTIFGAALLSLSMVGILLSHYINRGNSVTYYSNSGNTDLSDYYQTAQNLAQKQQSTEITFLAAGDIMLSRKVAQTAARANDNELPFKKMAEVFAGTDFNFANLESPFSGKDTFNAGETLVFNAPTYFAPILKKYNFSILNLANNHALDQGKEALLYTKDLLQKTNIIGLGVGSTQDEAWQGKIITVKGINIGFIGASYASINDNGKTKNEFVARMEDTDKLISSVNQLRADGAQFIIVTMHAGTEYVRNPNSAQIDFARTAIDNGADIVIGAHPHWVQTIEQYKGKYIFYSLGNFIFDQEWSQDTKEGLTLKVTIEGKPANLLQGSAAAASLKQIELLPIIIENFSTPRLANEQESDNIFEKIKITERILYP